MRGSHPVLLPLPLSLPLPARPSVSPSSRTGERGICCACGGLSSAATTHGERAVFASAVRKASRGVGSAGERLQRAEDIAK